MQPDWRSTAERLLKARHQAEGYADTDRLGRPSTEMKTVGGASWQISAFPHLHLPRMREVPQAGIEEEREHEYLLNCPCGHHPAIDRELDAFQSCPGCERSYVTFRQKLWVLYGNMPIPGASKPASS